MKNYRSWVKEEGRRFIEKMGPVFAKDKAAHGGATAEPDFGRWLDEHDHLVEHAREIGRGWGLGEVHFVNANSPSRDEKAVSRDQAIDAFVRDLSRVVRQLWRKRS